MPWTPTDAPAALVARARILLADAAHALGDDARAVARLDEVTATGLSAADQEGIRDDLDRGPRAAGEPSRGLAGSAPGRDVHQFGHAGAL